MAVRERAQPPDRRDQLRPHRHHRRPGGDTRTPYGDIAWDGDENAGSTVISGIGWGDRYKFKTTAAPLTRNSSWDYASRTGLVAAAGESSDSEMGAVQSQTYQQKDAGGYWFYKNWGKTWPNPGPR